MGWTYLDIWFRGSTGFVRVIIICRDSLVHVFNAPMPYPRGHVPLTLYEFYSHGISFIFSSQHGSLTFPNISNSPSQFVDSNAHDPEGQKSTEAQVAPHNLHFPCHV